MTALEIHEEERALVSACARRDPEAFALLIGRYGSILASGCRRALVRSGRHTEGSDLDEAHAVVQERLWREADRIFGGFRFECPLEAWLRLVAFRTALNWALAESSRQGLGLARASEAAAPEEPDAVEAEEQLALLRKAMDRLGEPERSLLEDAYVLGLGYRELAERRSLASGSLGPLLLRAREKLGKIMKSMSEEGSSP